MTSSSSPIVSLTSPMMSSSPLVSKVLERRRKLHESRAKWKWALANLFGAFLAFIEGRKWHFLIDANSCWRSLVSGIETLMILVFLTNATLDLLHHFFPLLDVKSFFFDSGSGDPNAQDLVLTPQQMRLFRINKGDPGFKVKEEKKAVKNEGHPFGFGPPKDGSFIAPSPQFHQETFNASLDSSSWHYIPSSPPKSPPEVAATYTPKFNSSFEVVKDQKGLRQFLREYDEWEKSRSHLSNTSMQAEHGDSTVASGWKMATPGTAPQTPRRDFSPFLKKIAYQISSPMPAAATEANKTSPDHPTSPKSPISKAAHDSVSTKLQVDPIKVIDYLENLRMWISQTVLRRLVHEIDATNELLVKHGMSDERIGLIGIEKLKKVALLPNILHHIPSLDALIPFLEFHPNQEYLVQRYRDLSDGGALSDFKWNSGSKFKGVEWNDKLPTDAELVMTCLSAYLDTRLPRNFVSNDGKPFTGIYYNKFTTQQDKAPSTPSTSKRETQSFISKLSPDVQSLIALSPKRQVEKEVTSAKPESDKSLDQTRGCVIVQSSVKPPCYELHLKDIQSKSKGSKEGSTDGIIKINVGPGRNNLFYTILLFLYHVKTQEHGLLGRIHFGSSGVNMLRVIEVYD